VLHQGDDIAAFAAAATVPDPLADVDAEAVLAAAGRTGSDELDADAFQAGVSARRGDNIGRLGDRDVLGGDHGRPPSRRAMSRTHLRCR